MYLTFTPFQVSLQFLLNSVSTSRIDPSCQPMAFLCPCHFMHSRESFANNKYLARPDSDSDSFLNLVSNLASRFEANFGFEVWAARRSENGRSRSRSRMHLRCCDVPGSDSLWLDCQLERQRSPSYLNGDGDRWMTPQIQNARASIQWL